MSLRPAWLSRSALGRSLWTFRREFAWVGVFSLFANVLLLAPTLYMMQIFDRIFISRNEWTLIALTLIVLVFFAAMAFAEWVRSRLLVRAGVRFDEFLNSRVFTASFEANLNLARHNPVQSFNDLLQIRQFLTGNGVFAFFDTPWTPIYLLVLFMMHPVLGWTSVAFVILLGVLAWVSHRLTAPRHERAGDAAIASTTYLSSKLRNAETVQAMGMLGNLRRQWLALYDGQMGSQIEAQRAAMRVQAFVKFVQYTQQSIILAVGAWLVVRGELSAGGMIASNALMSNALRPISTLVSTWKQFIDARQSWGRLEQLLEEHPERVSGQAAGPVRGQLTLRGLVATAPNRPQPILKGLDVEFQANEVVAIVGPSGAGKSTLARCLIGIWPQTSGQVLLDGHPIESRARDELGPHLGYLPQDIELFEGTIAENIARFGRVDPALIIEAAQHTGIHDMILRLPRGYDTPMGVAGNLLSGGQRQRVGLARAIYGNPELVVLDEPNANLDDVGLAALVRTIQALKARGSTVFLIVHQRNLLAVADRVLVLNDGVITQLGQLAQTRTASA
jgi:ATP-binding cassette subfamily C exporter for protease/lipase